MAQLYTRRRLGRMAETARLDEEAVLTMLENQRADLAAVVAWVEENEGTTLEETLGNAWLPGNAPGNARDVIAVAAAARLIVQVDAAKAEEEAVDDGEGDSI